MSIDEILPLVVKPSRYCGNEYNVIKKEWSSVELRVALAFPDLYEIGMSHQGLQILYHLLNGRDNFLAERVYAPDRDLEKLLRQRHQPLFALESGRPLGEFDMLGITLPYELCYSNILTIIDLAGLPLYSRDRDNTHPLVIGGGPCAFHPEPVADFFDAILLGDGEEAVLEIAETIATAKKAGVSRPETLVRLSKIPGLYVPSFFEPQYGDDGRLTAVKPLHDDYGRVRRAVIADLDSGPDISRPLVPQTRTVHDRLGLELARGCTRGCRFCQAGIIYRPVRERQPQKVMELARAGIAGGGFDELALLSLSTGDYSCLSPLLVALMDTFARQHVSVSMPSMRVGTLTPEIMEQIKRVRKTGFTIAPEAGSDRLRRVINKGISEEDLLSTVQTAFGLGWKLIKLYFMFGLPMETDDDLAAIPTLVNKALQVSGRFGNINVSAGTFVPKPHTPFQWEPQLNIEEGYARIDYLKKNLPKRAKLKWNDPKTSYLEGVFSRGDRKLSTVIVDAWQHGARLDAWSEIFDLELWRQAADRCRVDFDDYLRRRDIDEVLPWQHLDAGVDEQFFKDELAKAKVEEYTPDCRNHGCQKCGLCDFKTIKPVVHKGGEILEANKDCILETGVENQRSCYYWVSYQRLGRARFLGHLELLQLVFRALQRAGLPVLFSHGFNPSPKVSFSPALSVGTQSLAEYFIVEVAAPLSGLPDWRERLNAEMPVGISVNGIKLGTKKQPARIMVDYQVRLAAAVDQTVIEDFLNCSEYLVEVLRKKRVRKIDARPLVKELSQQASGELKLTLFSETSKAGIKPFELVGKLFNLPSEKLLATELIKLSYKEV